MGCSNNHEEADTKICMHAKAADTSNGNVVIRASVELMPVVFLHAKERLLPTYSVYHLIQECGPMLTSNTLQWMTDGN